MRTRAQRAAGLAGSASPERRESSEARTFVAQAPMRRVVDVVLPLVLLVSLAAIGAAQPRLTTVTPRELGRALRPDKGRPLLVHVWASWCVPCRAEWPRLAAYLRQLGDKRLDVVTVALDEPSQAEAAARVLEESGGVPGRCLLAAVEPAGARLRSPYAAMDGGLPTTPPFACRGALPVAQRGVTRGAA